MRNKVCFLSRPVLSILLGLVIFAVPVFGDEPSPDPQLRVEAGMHTSVVRRVSTDSRGRWALTSSDDKTARVWNLGTGRLMMILRPPAGAGNEGKLFSCAMSPDGNIAALAGWTGYEWYGEHQIYLFDRSTGRLTRSLTGIANVINHMAFSPDGRYLAAVLGSNNGIRVWDLSSDAAPFSDTAYDSDSYGLTWTRDGRLATTSYDGNIRLYKVSQSGLKNVATVKGRGGEQPNGIAFSPDGRQILVGFSDRLAVDIYNGQSLEWTRSLPVPENASGDLASVAWSSDGRFIYAGGRYQSSSTGVWLMPVVRWPASKPVEYIEIPATESTIMALSTLPDGEIFLGSFDPQWGKITAAGEWLPLGKPPIADFRNQGANFALSDDARTIRFGYEAFGTDPWGFSIGGRSLVPGEVYDTVAADNTSIPLKNWEFTYEPTLKGKKLGLERYEWSCSFAAAPDGKRFVLGTGWYLHGYDSTGKELWKIAAPGTVWAVNIPAGGKVVAAVYGDGTIRWHRMSDGKELLAFFPHADKKRWILWTPSGYYDASPGGEELIGWHVNRGIDNAADFFPAGRFRDRYYRPDVIDLILSTFDETVALKQADEARGSQTRPVITITEALPPVIDLVSPSEISTSDTAVTIKFRVRTTKDAPVTSVRSRVNGQVTETKGFAKVTAADQDQTITITIPKQTSEIQLFAENKNGISVPATIRVVWTGTAEEFVILPKLYVLAIGVGDYKHPDIPKLKLAGKDARDFAATMSGQKGKMYREVEMIVLTEKQATRDGILEGLDWLQKSVTQHDVGMLFLSGHGLNDPAMGYVYLPYNADPDKLRTTGVAMYEFKITLASLTGKAVFFLDTCHSGNVLGETRRAVGNDIGGVINDLSSAENGVVVFSSSTGRQYSLESPEWGNGAFTKAIIEGLSGKADFQGTGRITFKMLDLYVSERVKVLTGGQQSPVTQAPGGVPDFPLAVK
jgi:WD40 repeat protein